MRITIETNSGKTLMVMQSRGDLWDAPTWIDGEGDEVRPEDMVADCVGWIYPEEDDARVQAFASRDIGYGVETGEVMLPALDEADWTGKRPYRTVGGDTVYLFDDELLTWRDAMGALAGVSDEPAEVNDSPYPRHLI